STIVGVLTLGTLEADVPKTIDVPKQIGVLKNSKSARERATAAEEIGRYGAIKASAVRDAIEPLENAAKNDPDADVRRAAIKALGDIAPDATKTVPLLMEALKDKSATVKLAAVGALGQYGPEARSALAALRELAANKTDKKFSMAAKAAIKSISGKKN
ncbi:MAG TPA: HEAT repeat domain-containing protein, partial [Gemmataceae bacterium]|nr:HEAT repeat domain-containing protein [Gemmataceae bacterium]